ncbi:MAG TPA: acetylornithine deacetylase/succinyl-diaminopimelate desuccinylase family protein [Blastocatellia bacterium]|nr:acetylornithine deacetylase/succinyl-diaminopimelate desuccinylase family protein [Blastocatellia bacterium]
MPTADQNAVCAEVDRLADEMVAFVQSIVRIPSVNPPGEHYAECADAIGGLMQQFGYEVRFVTATDGPEHTAQFPRVNVIGQLSGHGPGRTLHFNGHVDVVPPGGGWTLDPFAAVIKEGRIYGRGATDQKAGIAASLFAIEAIKRVSLKLNGAVVQSATVDEESGGLAGVDYLVERGCVKRASTDYVIITEPLGFNRVCLGHRGVYWFEVETRGRIAHGSMPFLGASAIDRQARFISRIESHLKPKHAERISAMPIEPRDARRASININSIAGGQSVDEPQTPCVADACRAIFDRRFIIEEDFSDVRGEIVEVLEEMRAGDDDFDYELKDLMIVHPTMTEPDAPVVRATASSIREVTGWDAALIASPGTYDQKHFARLAGIEQCIAYGPGILALAHQPDEYCEIEHLIASCKVMALTALRPLE